MDNFRSFLVVGLCVVFLLCWIGAVVSLFRASRLRNPKVALFSPVMWLQLTPCGKRLRNRGIGFMLAMILAGLIAAFIALSGAAPQ
jgi:uncharacterized membrane protein